MRLKKLSVNSQKKSFLHVVYSGGNGEKYHVSISCFPSSTLRMFRTFVTSSCSRSAFGSNSACSSSCSSAPRFLGSSCSADFASISATVTHVSSRRLNCS